MSGVVRQGENLHPVWLVEIRLKDWCAALPTGSRIVSFEEVLAANEYEARHAGYDQFTNRCRYEPVTRRKMKQWGLELKDVCAPDAVQLDS